MLTCVHVCVYVYMQHCDTVIAQHTTSKQELAPPSVLTAKIVSDHITLAVSQADGWDVKFEGGNEVRLDLHMQLIGISKNLCRFSKRASFLMEEASLTLLTIPLRLTSQG